MSLARVTTPSLPFDPWLCLLSFGWKVTGSGRGGRSNQLVVMWGSHGEERPPLPLCCHVACAALSMLPWTL